MADNFRITRRLSGDVLHLKLSGDFDGTAAMELLDVIASNSGTAHRIYIQTDGLGEMLPFGQRVFEKKLPGSPAWGRKLVFTGPYSRQFPRGLTSRHGTDSTGIKGV